jgi:hypothetical protein
MHDDDQYLDRTPDLVARVRAMREVAQKQMDRFSRVSDYDVRSVVGHGTMPVSSITASSHVTGQHKDEAAESSVQQVAQERDAEGEHA